MHADDEWEEELDTIADAIRAGLKGDECHSEIQSSPVDATQLGVWFDALADLLNHCQQENNPEELSEVLDLLALLLKTCAHGQWKCHLQESPSQSRHFFSNASLQKIVNAVDVVCGDDDDRDAHAAAIESFSSLLFIASTADDVENVLKVIRGLPTSSSIHIALHSSDATSHDVHDKWTRHFLRFVTLFISPRASPSDDQGRVLRALTGANVSDWIQHTWEKKWHLHRSASVGIQLLGSAEQLVANLRRVLDGISIPPVNPAASETHSESAAVMALRYADEHCGLRHGVDVTLIKDGQVHPLWTKASDRDRIVRPRDTDQALQDGYTIGIRGMQARSLPVYTLCDALQRKLGQHVNANLYWTPSGQQGFDIHVDDHCVFVLQLKGSKRWFLYKPLEILPMLYDDTTAALREHTPLLETEILVEEGDVLYVPRGVPHHADTHGLPDESIHLTIGVEIEQAHTAGRVIQELAEPSAKRTHKWHFEGSSQIQNQGLMSWHLERTDTFLPWLGAVTGSDITQLPAIVRDESEELRQKLHEERQCFLDGRSTSARAMATLHVAQWTDSAEPEAMPLRVLSPHASGAEVRPNKKHRSE